MPGLPGGAYPGQVLFPSQTLSTTEGRVTQALVEVLSLPAAAARVTQVVVELLAANSAPVTPLLASATVTISTTAALTVPATALAASAGVRVSTTATLTLLVPLRVTQAAAEVFGAISPLTTRVTQTALDAFGTSTPLARVTQVVLEVFGPAPEIRFTRDPAIGLTWVEFTDAAGTTHVWSDVALPDPISYYFGFKDNRVTRWGTVRRSLSDDAGQYVGSELAWTVSDADRAVRALLADPATRAFANRPCVVRMIPDPGRRALERPRDVYFGVVRDYQPSSPLTVDFTARDYFDALFNPTGDQLFPRRVVTTADFPLATGSFTVGANPFTDPPTPGTAIAIGAIHLPVPIIYGRITDQFLVDGEDQGDGQCPAVLVGVETLGDGREYYQWLVAGHACQGIDELYVNNDPQGLATDPAIGGSGGLWKVPGYAGWTDEFPAPYRDINGHRYTLVYGRRGPETTISASAIGDPAVFTVADTSLFVDGADTIVADHQGATPSLDGVYPITILDATHVSVPVALTAAGTGGTLRQVFGPDIAAGAAEPRGQSVPFALDVRGIETTGDGTGTLIVDGPLQYLHALLNWIIGDYQTGPWTSDPPIFPDASRLPMVDVSSFVRANAIAHARVDGGYRGDFVLGATAIGPGRNRQGGTRITARELLQRFNASFDVSVGFNRHSQFMVAMLDDSPAGLAAQALAPLFVDMTDVVKDSLTITDDVARLYNRIPWRDTEDYFGRMSGADAQPFTQDLNDTNWRSLNSGVSYTDDAASIGDYSTNPAILTPMVAPTRLLYLVRSKARDVDSDVYLQGTATREDVIARYLARHRDPPRTARFTIGLLGFNLDLGDVVRLTHFAGVGAQGWVERRLRILAHDADLRQQLVTLTAEDLGTGAE
jgi:hypothetical protein